MTNIFTLLQKKVYYYYIMCIILSKINTMKDENNKSLLFANT